MLLVPAVQVRGLREVGVALQSHFAKAGLTAKLHRAVEVPRNVFVRRPVTGTVLHVKNFSRVGQRDEKRMIRQAKLEDRTAPVDTLPVDALGDAELLDQLLHAPQPSSSDGLRPLGEFVVNGGRIDHGGLPVPVGFVDALGGPPLPGVEFLP